MVHTPSSAIWNRAWESQNECLLVRTKTAWLCWGLYLRAIQSAGKMAIVSKFGLAFLSLRTTVVCVLTQVGRRVHSRARKRSGRLYEYLCR